MMPTSLPSPSVTPVTPKPLRLMVSSASAIERAIRKYYYGGASNTTAKPVATSNGGTKVTGRITQLVASPTRPLRYVNVHIQARQAYGTYWFDAGSTKTNGHGYFGWNTSVKPSACYRYRAIYKGNSNGWAAKSTTAEWSNCG